MPDYPVYRLPRSPISLTVVVLTALLVVVIGLGVTAVVHLRIEQNARIAKDAYGARQKDLINRRTLWEEEHGRAFRAWQKENMRRREANIPELEYVRPERPAEFDEIEDDIQRQSAAREEMDEISDEIDFKIKMLEAENVVRDRRR